MLEWVLKVCSEVFQREALVREDEAPLYLVAQVLVRKDLEEGSIQPASPKCIQGQQIVTYICELRTV